MKFVTKAHAKVDRIARPWLIQRFIDKNARFFFVPADEVRAFAERENAIPFDIEGVELGHVGPHCSFDAFIKKYGITDPTPLELAKIVRGADTSNRSLTDESAGLYAIASGFHARLPEEFPDDHAFLNIQFPIYDALYAFCRTKVATSIGDTP